MRLISLAARNLSRNRRRTAISLVALIVGVGVMIALRGFINGQQRTILENVVNGQLGSVQVHKAGYLANVLGSPLDLDMADTPELRAKIAAVRGVKAVAPRIAFGAMLAIPDKQVPDGRELTEDEKGKTSFFLATAIDPELELKVTPKKLDWMSQGKMFPAADAEQVLLNADFAKGVEAKVSAAGEQQPLEEWPALLAADRDGSLNGANVQLAGTVVVTTPGDKKFGYVPLKTAQKVLRMEGRVTEYAVAIDDFDASERVRDELRAALGPEYEVHTWFEILPFIKELVGTQDFIFGIVILIFLLVVLVGIVNVMLMNVLERVREIGTMLAVGMKRRQIVGLFLLEGMTLGLVGGVIGVLIGFLAVQVMGSLGINLPAPGSTTTSILHPFIGLPYMVRACFLATVGSGLATLWPAVRASRLRPVEALQSL
jgi:putative ABC transport system permease protein